MWGRGRAAGGAVLIVLVALPVAGQSTAAIKALLVRQSIAAYAGACPCPYSVMRNGRKCGGRSAYSRPGGQVPLCYPSDVTAAMLARRR